MAKRIKFTLEVKDGVQARTMEDLQEHFDLEKVVGYFSDGRLLSWLEDRYYENEAETIKALSKDKPDFHKKLCEALGVEIEEDISQVDIEELEYRKERLEKLKQYTADEKIWEKVDCVAFDQEELGDLLHDGETEIILCNNKFSIPLKEKNKKYIGVGRVEAKISSKEKVDFAELGIQFENVKFDTEYDKIHSQTPEYFLEMANEVDNDEEAVKYLQKAVDMGNAEAMYELGWKYLNGEGVSEDKEKAVTLFQKGAAKGDSFAMLFLGEMYMVGDGVSLDKQEGIKWIRKAADAENPLAMKSLADYYYDANGLPQDYKMAFEWYKKAAELEYTESMINVATCYHRGTGVKKNNKEAIMWLNKSLDKEESSNAAFWLGRVYGDKSDDYIYNPEKSFQWYLKSAELGDNYAMDEVGDCYRWGVGVDENINKAKEWYLKAADNENYEAMNSLGILCHNSAQEAADMHSANELYKKANKWYRKAIDGGHVVAMANLAHSYLNGMGTDKSTNEAIKWYTKAAEEGYVDAMVSLGKIYSDNNNKVTRNFQKAKEWYTKAADKGNTDAMFYLGDMYYGGYIGQKNFNKALKWFEKSAKGGDADAMNMIGYMYNHGEGVSKNLSMAMEWYHKAANAGSSTAMSNIGYAYDEGEGVAQNYAEAIRWYKMSADAGNSIAMRLIGKLYYNGNGVSEDVNLAMQWWQRAAEAGDDTAKRWIDEVRSGNTGKDEKSGCFITTAVCDSFAKPDDCYELSMFRNFRDTWLVEQEDGKSLIEEYYQIAPQIVKRINQAVSPQEIYRSIWVKYLSPCLTDIENNAMMSCKERYVQMVKDLREKYLS